MISRYTHPEMAEVWTDENRFRKCRIHTIGFFAGNRISKRMRTFVTHLARRNDGKCVLLNLSGRGDKDLDQIAALRGTGEAK